MSEPVIRAEKLGKRYKVGEHLRYLALRDVLANALKAPLRLPRRAARPGPTNHEPQHIWALKNVAFDVHQGEVVGLIGRNGAGKTTLLKILSRVTRPTEGWAEVRGRVGSLLEVGTGFHSELTGRENVYLSGAILGMKKKEINAKFDEIVAFADVAKFIDTPFKYYSTGMQTRLAFAVAAHLEPEILLVDEVLAVGDIEFQKKCLGKMSEVARGGRTILFVSHQMNQIRRLCERILWIDGGRIRDSGPTEAVISAYEQSAISPAEPTPGESDSHENISFSGWEVVEPRGLQTNVVRGGLEAVALRVHITSIKPVRRGAIAARIYDDKGYLLSGWSFDRVELAPGANELLLRLAGMPLRPGAYSFFIQVFDDDYRRHQWTFVPPLVVDGTPVTHFMDEWAGVLNISCSLECRQIEPRARTD